MTHSNHNLLSRMGMAFCLSLGIVTAIGANAQLKPAPMKADSAEIDSKTYILPKESSAAVLAATAITPARDLVTQESDRTLTNNCVEGGYDKEECLCATQILKYELSVRDYDAAALIFALESDPDSTDENLNREEPKAELYKKGYSVAELADLDRMTRDLMDGPDFTYRCQTAAAYYTPKPEA
ncbi:hypothetical protein [Litorimonas sp.]|uniref:hypothetical protein n=1 Tax=Litorimonas sp. TaxID=1892381 RepID=UPI003A852058